MQSTLREWRLVDGFDYEVSNDGLVRRTGLVLKPGLDRDGYVRVSLYGPSSNRKNKLVHVLVGNAFIPNPDNKPCLDHINGDIRDNRVENLRWASKSENGMNRSKQKNNASGYKGVYWNRGSNKWRAYIKRDGKDHHLGYFKTAEEAAEAYNKAAIELHGEFARINPPIAKIQITITLKT
jgi:hypothetical protein